MSSPLRRLVIWSVDGPARFQGRAIIAITFILMLLPIFVGSIVLPMLGVEDGSAGHRWFMNLVLVFWAVAFLFFVAASAFAVWRLIIASKDFVISLREWWANRA